MGQQLPKELPLALGAFKFDAQPVDGGFGFGEGAAEFFERHWAGGYAMEPMFATDTQEIIFMPRDDRWDDGPTQPPHGRSERTLEALWRELEEAKHPDWVRCLALAVADANGVQR